MEVETQADTKVPKIHQDILAPAGDSVQPNKVENIPIKTEMVAPARGSCQPNADDVMRQRIELATPGRSKLKYFLKIFQISI